MVPKDKKFFPLFEQASSNLIEIATNLHEAVNLPLKEREVLFQKIDTLEQKGEDITRQTNLELSRNFITPFDREDINNPNNVKVITDQQGFALYFSRSVIPFPRDENVGVRYMKHIGIYAFRKEALMDFYRLPMVSLEASEKLEQLRYLEYGKRIKMIETTHGSIGIDTIEDLEKARKLI